MEEVSELRRLAATARDLAEASLDPHIKQALREMAEEYEVEARRLENRPPSPPNPTV